jgi:DivIVA domain-containing protein
MPLTPEDVQNKEFTTVRLREGYDMQEVDEFLDEVEAELSRMQRENDELRDKLSAVTRGGGVAASAEPLQPSRQPEPAPIAPPTSAMQAPSPGHQSEAATKVLALAQKTADELVADARAEADRLMSDSRSRAEKIDSETKAKAAKIEQDARQRADSIDQEVQKRRTQALGKIDQERSDLERELETLRSFEREYRSRLKSYLENELRKLEMGGVAEADSKPGGDSQDEVVLETDSTPVPAPASANTKSGVGSGGNNNNSSPPQPQAQPQVSQQAASQTGGSLRSVASLLDDDNA